MQNKEYDIVQLIYSYTDQIERYESMSTWFSAFCIVCILVVLLSAAVLIIYQKKQDSGRKELCNMLLSGIFLIIPSIVTLYLYTFAMNMRKVALYRGYLSFLESQYNELTQMNVMLFDNGIVDRFLSVRSFPVNGLGPAIMIVFIIAAFFIGFGLSIHFVKRLSYSQIRDRLKLAIIVLMAVCIFFDGLCCYYLSINDRVVASVISYCEEQGGALD